MSQYCYCYPFHVAGVCVESNVGLYCAGHVDPLADHETVEVQVDGDIGRRYAAVSGDYNPHHLYGWTARLIGYPRQIAHGMWTLSRCLSSVEREHLGTETTPFQRGIMFELACT